MTLTLRKPSDAAPKRLGALAKLPVFWDLTDKRAVVAGGTAAAAWKAELLAAAGGRVEIFAEAIEPEMSALIDRGAASGSLTHHARAWTVDDLDQAAIALADAATDAEAEAFFNAAKAFGTPVNVIDKPAFCQFQFGSIVNRSPVVIGISTDGAAPILGQSVRRRIETLLPPSLAAWARLAKTARKAVMRRLAGSRERRAFWEHFSDMAFGSAPTSRDEEAVDELIDELSNVTFAKPGRVTLVGAGPGDAELLTLKAVRALQSADVILFDDLVSDDVLELARREAKRMLVGKRGRRESCAQEDINDLMVKLSGQGKHVVRLKSGDPMIFGRAGEEIGRLQEEGIPVDVVPGITAASALAAALGKSLTHRDRAHSVRYVTGHSRSGQLPEDLDWKGIADPKTTTAFYMGGRTAPDIAQRLLREGLKPDTPVTIASSVSRPGMTVHNTNLGLLSTLQTGPTFAGPVLLAIGSVFSTEGNQTHSESSMSEQELGNCTVKMQDRRAGTTL